MSVTAAAETALRQWPRSPSMAEWAVSQAVYFYIAALEVDVLICRIPRAESDVMVLAAGHAARLNTASRCQFGVHHIGVAVCRSGGRNGSTRS
jgi:hypothetical protein